MPTLTVLHVHVLCVHDLFVALFVRTCASWSQFVPVRSCVHATMGQGWPGIAIICLCMHGHAYAALVKPNAAFISLYRPI